MGYIIVTLCLNEKGFQDSEPQSEVLGVQGIDIAKQHFATFGKYLISHTYKKIMTIQTSVPN